MEALPTLTKIERKKEEARRLEKVGQSLGSSPTRQLVQMVLEAGPSESARKKLMPTAGDKAPCKEFLKAGMLKKPQKYQLGTVALHKICQFQKSTDLICKHPFLSLIHKIAQEVGKYDLHFQVHMVMALQEAAEYYLTSLLEDTNLWVIHAKCITIMPKGTQLAHCIHGEHLHH